MSRLGNILNAIINPFGKTLWEGSASSGTITVPDTSKYSAFIVEQGGDFLVGLKDGGTIRGFGCTGTTYQYLQTFMATVSGNTWTIGYSTVLTHQQNSNHGASTTKAITKIIGLVPNWGGVLLNCIISLGHFRKEVVA